jgi:hypothetical protein
LRDSKDTQFDTLGSDFRTLNARPQIIAQLLLINGLKWNGRAWRYVSAWIGMRQAIVCLASNHCDLVA